MNRKYSWCMLVEVSEVVAEVATRTNTEFVEFADSDDTTYAIFRLGDKVVKVPCDEIFEDYMNLDEKIRALSEKVTWYVKNEVLS
jgi:hypothetical protein